MASDSLEIISLFIFEIISYVDSVEQERGEMQSMSFPLGIQNALWHPGGLWVVHNVGIGINYHFRGPLKVILFQEAQTTKVSYSITATYLCYFQY